jgi:hypothetical protein
MQSFRMLLVAGFAIGLAGAAVPSLAQASKQMKGVLEKIDASDHHVVIRDVHGHKGSLPLAVATDAKIVTPEGSSSLAALHVGDEVTVHYGAGPHGEQATEIQVTKSVPAK